MFRNLLIISIISISSGFVTAQDQTAYIRTYQDIAVSEMLRSGIPASIKLAQAILESNCGKSELACKANNHFGIKCGGNWSGKSFHKEDDDYAHGKLVKSCFREFDSVLDGYMAHSDFLTDPSKSTRYGPLFQLEITDYKGWARGLSKAGYATDPQYANRLIDIIEKYELYRFDNEYEHELVSASARTVASRQVIKYANDVKYTLALQGDNALLLARRNSMSAGKVLRYNENIDTKDQALPVGSRIYLEAKKSKYHGKQKYHVLKEGEDLETVSALYGVKLESLAKRNGLTKDQIPQPRQKIMLKGKSKSELRTMDPYELPEEKKPNSSRPGPSYNAGNTDHAIASAGNTPDTGIRNAVPDLKASPEHTVMKGDTLYGIARTYGVSVDELRKKNNLAADTIYIGQKLVWK